MRAMPYSIVVAASLVLVGNTSADDHAHAPAHAPATPQATQEKTDPAAPAVAIPANDAFKMLIEGNARFVAGKPTHPNQALSRLCDTFTGQHPYAAVLTCADSRVPPELIFDAGIGDLFVVRVAGNVADVDETGTLEYGVEHLGINAILVLGHTKCGAVTAVVDGAHVTPNIAKLVDNIVPAAETARKANPHLTGAPLVSKTITLNVGQSVNDLLGNSDLLRARVAAGTLKIVGGVYDLHTGEVTWLDITPSPSPSQPAPKTDAPHAAQTKPDAHHDAGHANPADAHGTSHKGDGHDHDAEEKSEDPGSHVEAPVKKDNFIALGGLLGGAAVTSSGLLFFMSRRGS